jgi:RNA polymerase sigma-70 factor, ECF subfamily
MNEPVSPSVEQLVRVAAAGDQRAFAELHARHAHMVHAILLSRLPPSDAEDQVQEVFLLAWKKLAQLDDARLFGAWLGTIARNRAAEFYRRRHADAPLAEALPAAHASGSDVAEARHVLAAIQTLPEAYRETLVMRLCEGMNGPEIAAVTGLEPGSVRINLHRGMKLLREKLGIADEQLAKGGRR